MLIAHDGGYYNTKWVTDTKRNVFRSRISSGYTEITRCNHMILDDEMYTIGVQGAFSSDSNKINDTTFKVCLYASIAQAMGDKTYDPSIKLVTGLPLDYFQEQRKLLKESLIDDEVDLIYNKAHKQFKIKDVLVFPQSAGLFISRPDLFKENVYYTIVDIGGFTVDVSVFSGVNFIKGRSFQKGILNLYGNIRADLSSKGFDYDIFDISSILQNEFIIVDCNKVSYKVDILCENYMNSLLSSIKVEFPEYKNSIVYFIGGGSAKLCKFINTGHVVENSLYANADSFYALGKVKLT